MLYIRNDSNEPYFNLALEEYVLKTLGLEEDSLLLWQNRPSVIIGRFQNTVDEVNVDYLQKNSLNVVRRISGGGAVYNDYGTINYSFIEKNPNGIIDFQRFTGCIINALNKMGVPAELSGRNNILANNKKIGWSVQYHHNRKTLHHGTLLFNTDLENMREALAVKKYKQPSKGDTKCKEKIGNIQDYFNNIMTVEKFKSAILNEVFNDEPVREYLLTEKDIAKVKEFTAEKYITWKWNYGSSQMCTIKKFGRFIGGGIEICLSVEKGIICGCKVYGDFLGSEEIGDFEAGLIGVRYEKKAVGSIINNMNIRRYFGELREDELTGLFF